MNKLLVKPIITLFSATAKPVVVAPVVNISKRNIGFCFGTYKGTNKDDITTRQDGRDAQKGFHPEQSQKSSDQFKKD